MASHGSKKHSSVRQHPYKPNAKIEKFDKLMTKLGVNNASSLEIKPQEFKNPIEDKKIAVEDEQIIMWFTTKMNHNPGDISVDEMVREWLVVDKELNYQYTKKNVFIPLLHRLTDHIGQYKNILSAFDRDVLNRARKRSDKFYKVGNAGLMNRAGMKLAEINFLLRNFLKPQAGDTEVHFATICDGPGAFTQYIRKISSLYPGVKYMGYGITLPGPDDFKRELLTKTENFEFYIQNGNIYEDIVKETFYTQLPPKGVKFVICDGGFDVSGKELQQEILSKRLYIAQTRMALRSLAIGGDLLLKLFDVNLKFSIELIYLICCCFKSICLLKPLMSRGANSERYLFCQNFKHRGNLEEYLKCVELIIDKGEVVVEQVDQNRCYQNIDYLKFMKVHLSRFSRAQVGGLETLTEYCKDDSVQIKPNNCDAYYKDAIKLSIDWMMHKKL